MLHTCQLLNIPHILVFHFSTEGLFYWFVLLVTVSYVNCRAQWKLWYSVILVTTIKVFIHHLLVFIRPEALPIVHPFADSWRWTWSKTSLSTWTMWAREGLRSFTRWALSPIITVANCLWKSIFSQQQSLCFRSSSFYLVWWVLAGVTPSSSSPRRWGCSWQFWGCLLFW